MPGGGTPLLQTAVFVDQFDELDDPTKHFLADVADTAATRWREDDEGIWEVRGGRRPFLCSKLMCWVALDRAIAMAGRLDARDRVDWVRVREEIRTAILEGGEGAFLLCTFWLAQAQAMAGRLDDARATFRRAAACVNDLGLLSEEADPATGELLGNFPQAFSHIGLINAAAMAEAKGAEASRP